MQLSFLLKKNSQLSWVRQKNFNLNTKLSYSPTIQLYISSKLETFFLFLFFITDLAIKIKKMWENMS